MSNHVKILLIREKEGGNYQSSVHRGSLSVISELRKVVKVTEIWVLQEGKSRLQQRNTCEETFNVFEFTDGVDLIDKLCPHLVLISSDYEFLSRSIILAATHRGIPTVILLSLFLNLGLLETNSFARLIRGRIQALRVKGSIILKKYAFLLKTMRHSGRSWISLIHTILYDFYLLLNSFEPRYRFGGGDLNIVTSPAVKELLLARGIEDKKIAVTGDCGMDYLYEKLQLITTNKRNTATKQILFITEPMVEHGFWTEKQRADIVKGIVTTILSRLQNNWKLRIKIHPISESIEVYESILKSMDYSIDILQKEDIVSVVSESDIVIAFGHSSAIFPAVLLFKRVIIMNLLGADMKDNIYLSSNVASECKILDELPKIIKYGNDKLPNKEQVDSFIEKTLYQFDGKCSNRAAKSILSLLDDNN